MTQHTTRRGFAGRAAAACAALVFGRRVAAEPDRVAEGRPPKKECSTTKPIAAFCGGCSALLNQQQVNLAQDGMSWDDDAGWLKHFTVVCNWCLPDFEVPEIMYRALNDGPLIGDAERAEWQRCGAAFYAEHGAYVL